MNRGPSEAENAHIIREITERLNAEGTWSGELRNRRKDGRAVITSACISVLDSGGQRSWLAVQEDITGRKRAEEQARQHRAELAHVLRLGTMGAMAAGLAHELTQPLSAVSFVTDGIHWGSRDYAYLRNGMLMSGVIGIALLGAVGRGAGDALELVWLVTAAWICVRAALGWIRIWPAIGQAPLAPSGPGV